MNRDTQMGPQATLVRRAPRVTNEAIFHFPKTESRILNPESRFPLSEYGTNPMEEHDEFYPISPDKARDANGTGSHGWDVSGMDETEMKTIPSSRNPQTVSGKSPAILSNLLELHLAPSLRNSFLSATGLARRTLTS